MSSKDDLELVMGLGSLVSRIQFGTSVIQALMNFSITVQPSLSLTTSSLLLKACNHSFFLYSTTWVEDDQDTEEEIDKHPTIDKLITACEYYSERECCVFYQV
ncbi:hypothetical protein CYY_010432 [Polysphondylium violaceum]|uniref:Uncharacterized protein n=1 Tax=Polysphondylium violaceum TaxID=133409 RepID=A0A8J4PJU3_9MYCE|nr:hypothetical protein CYY_010432 [Polysphondylium violaceum]